MRPRGNLPHRSLTLILAIIALLLAALYVAGLVVDWPGWLRGSNWVWVRRVPALGARLWLLSAALAVGLALAAVAARGGPWSRRRTALLLAAAVVLTPAVQVAVAAQHRAQPLSAVVLSSGGFWQEGARIDDPLRFAREHAARMPAYADIHVRTQPPGWPLAYWAAAQVWARFPAAAAAVGLRLLRYDCLAAEMQGLSAAQLAAGSLRIAILALTGLGALPLYAIGRRFFAPAAARLAAVAYAYLPALLVFSGRFDVVYALLAVAAVWLALAAVLDGRRAAGAVLALLVALGSFLTFTALAIAGLAGVVAAAVALAMWGRGDRRLWRLAWLGAGMAAALLLFWGALRLAGIDGLAMWRVGQAIHREYRLNYPAWFLFNFYDLAVFMGFVPFAGAVGAAIAGGDGRAARGLALGWGAAVLLLNLSVAVRAETGRLWLFLMPLGLLVGVGWWAGRAGEDKAAGRPRRGLWAALLVAYLAQALVTGAFLGGRAAEPSTPAPVWRVPAGATALDYQLGDAVALRGYSVTPAAGGDVLTLYWQALDFPRAEFSAFVHALDANGQTISQSDGPPAAVPMWCWVPGEVVADARRLEGDTPAAGFAVGLYDPVSGRRLAVQPATPDDRIVLPGAE
ncbi:MAG TPA: hypothetical protein PLH39_03835 [Promineifilum sp.]|nr:hypothetical protein [Promineifilum sp.]